MTTNILPAITPPTEISGCQDCPLYNSAQLRKLGINTDDARYVVALAGNPNVGKSTVFNALTGLRQHVGNWPGKTVGRAEGSFTYGDAKYKIVDLPGTYSLLSTSTDEEIARDFILFGQPDVTVVVVDATRLERNLNLTLQILEITSQVVVALNLIDEAERHGLDVDPRHLSRKLGVPVIPMAARKGQGIPELLSAIAQVARGEYVTQPHRIQHRDRAVEAAIDQLSAQLRAEYPQLPNVRWVAMRLLEGDPSIEQAIVNHTLGSLAPKQSADLPAMIPLEAVS
jgi:ferrous iron transport protein B